MSIDVIKKFNIITIFNFFPFTKYIFPFFFCMLKFIINYNKKNIKLNINETMQKKKQNVLFIKI